MANSFTTTIADADDLVGRYTSLSRVQVQYGYENLTKWLDALDDGVTDAATVEERFTLFMADVESYVDDRLRGSVTIGDVVPATISVIATYILGKRLYDWRGIDDVDADGRPTGGRIAAFEKIAEGMLDKIKSGQIRLAADDRMNYIAVVEDDDD